MSRRRNPLHGVWRNMLRNCRVNKYYEGVSVCADWKSREAFVEWATTHGWRRGLMVTRRDKSADFSPENCVLVPIAVANGMRRCVRRLPDGRSARDIIGDKRLGLDNEWQARVADRLFSARWPVEKALISPKLRRPHTEASTVDGPYGVWLHLRHQCVTKGGLRQWERAAYEGITLCPEWRDSYEAFARWCKDNGWRRGMYVTRIDKRGDFCPENCAISTHIHIQMKGPRTWKSSQATTTAT